MKRDLLHIFIMLSICIVGLMLGLVICAEIVQGMYYVPLVKGAVRPV